MGIIGSPIDTSLLQAAQAQQTASKDKDRQRAAIDDRARRHQDLVDLRVAGVEEARAVRSLPSNNSEQGESEQRMHRRAAQLLKLSNARDVDTHHPSPPASPESGSGSARAPHHQPDDDATQHIDITA